MIGEGNFGARGLGDVSQFYDDEDPRVVTFWIKEVELGGKMTARPGYRRFLCYDFWRSLSIRLG